MRLARGLTLALALLGPASTAQAAAVGLADQQPASYADPRARALGLRYARLTVPWDAATAQPQAVAAWLAAVRAAGMAPHVAFEHLTTDRCPQRPCTTPTAAQYGAAIRRFAARFPQVRTYMTWNDANHASQPVADNPEAVAAYYDELRAACAGCTVVAGDVLDSGAYRRWLERFIRASTTTPRLCGACTTTATSPTAARPASTPCSPPSPEPCGSRRPRGAARPALEGGVVHAAPRAAAAARVMHRERPRLPRPGDRLHRQPPRRGARVPHLGAPPDGADARRGPARAARRAPGRAPRARRPPELPRTDAGPHRHHPTTRR
jgi:hypothetical protein